MMPKTNILTGVRLGMQGISGALQTFQNVLQNVVNVGRAELDLAGQKIEGGRGSEIHVV